jgi:hypothetical protein
VDVLDRLRRETLVEIGPVEHLHVGGGEGAELHAAQGGGEVQLHERAVALVGGDLHAPTHGVFEPTREVLPEGEAPGVVAEAPPAPRRGFSLEDLHTRIARLRAGASLGRSCIAA